jgi:hypothetical protein
MYYRARTAAPPRVSVNLIALAYLVIGLVVAATHNYYDHVDSVRAFGSAVLATILWPLLFLGINLHIH